MNLFKPQLAVLNIEASEARLMVMRGKRIEQWASIDLPTGAIRNGQVTQFDVVGRALDELFTRLRAPRRGIVVGLSGQRSLVRIFNLPAVEPRLLDETVRREARRELPLPLDELYLSWQIIGNHTAPRLQVFVLGVPRETLDACMAGLRAARLQPRAMDLKPLALARAVNLPDVLIADLEALTQDVILVRGGTPLIVRSIAAPPNARTTEDHAAALVVEIQRTLDFYTSSAGGRAPWSPVVCLTGKLSEHEAVRQQLEARWPLVQPSPTLPLPPDFPVRSFLTNIGLAQKRL